jgi:hypothetical protein
MTKTTTALTDDLQFGADETRNAAPDDKDDKFLWGAKAIAKSWRLSALADAATVLSSIRTMWMPPSDAGKPTPVATPF